MKKLLTTLLLATTIFTTLAIPTFAKQTITLIFNDKVLTPTVAPLIENGATLVPLRIVADSLGATTTYTKAPTNAYIEIIGKDVNIKLAVKAETGYPQVNGKAIDFKTLPKIVTGTTLVPVRFVSENLGLNVNYLATTKTVAISTKNFVPTPTIEVPTGKVTVKLDGKIITLEATPFFENGDLYVPPSIATKFGATVKADYIGCTLTRKDFIISMGYQAGATRVNWTSVPNKAHAIRKPNQTFIPLRFVAETLNCEVKFDSVTNTYNITNKGLIKVELTTERYNNVKGYVKDIDGNPVAGINIHLIPATADGTIYGKMFYAKFNISEIKPVKTDQNGYYEFKNIDTDKINFANINTHTNTDGPGTFEWMGHAGCEVDINLLNNVEAAKGYPIIRNNLKRIVIPTIYVRKDLEFNKN